MSIFIRIFVYRWAVVIHNYSLSRNPMKTFTQSKPFLNVWPLFRRIQSVARRYDVDLCIWDDVFRAFTLEAALVVSVCSKIRIQKMPNDLNTSVQVYECFKRFMNQHTHRPNDNVPVRVSRGETTKWLWKNRFDSRVTHSEKTYYI